MHTLEKRNCNIEKKEKISKSPPFPQIHQDIIVLILSNIKTAAIIFKDKKSNWNKKEKK
jgi:hypothetical protein